MVVRTVLYGSRTERCRETLVPHDTHTTDLAAARRLYDALAAHDARAILGALHPSFRGVASAGMPLGAAGVWEGPAAMLSGCWGAVFAAADVTVAPAEFLPVEDGRMVVLGRYGGHARATGRPLDAAFAHVLRFDGGLVSEIVQITDTARWHDALRP
jgi:2-(1,2-epoxy-1,2-dihydrophenyl)acetyl-CoA isomerase